MVDYQTKRQNLFKKIENTLFEHKGKWVEIAILNYYAYNEFGFGELAVNRSLNNLKEIGKIEIDYNLDRVKWIMTKD